MDWVNRYTFPSVPIELKQAKTPVPAPSAQHTHALEIIVLFGQHSGGKVATCIFHVYVEFVVWSIYHLICKKLPIRRHAAFVFTHPAAGVMELQATLLVKVSRTTHVLVIPSVFVPISFTLFMRSFQMVAVRTVQPVWVGRSVHAA